MRNLKKKIKCFLTGHEYPLKWDIELTGQEYTASKACKNCGKHIEPNEPIYLPTALIWAFGLLVLAVAGFCIVVFLKFNV